MAVTQTITISKDDGTTYSSMNDLTSAMFNECSMPDEVNNFIATCTSEGTCTNSTVLSEDGATVTITRVWDDAKWAEFAAMSSGDFDAAAAGWTVASSDDS
jgi:hypothetical protein